MIAINGYYVELWDLAYFVTCIIQGIIVFAIILAQPERAS